MSLWAAQIRFGELFKDNNNNKTKPLRPVEQEVWHWKLSQLPRTSEVSGPRGETTNILWSQYNP